MTHRMKQENKIKNILLKIKLGLFKKIGIEENKKRMILPFQSFQFEKEKKQSPKNLTKNERNTKMIA